MRVEPTDTSLKVAVEKAQEGEYEGFVAKNIANGGESIEHSRLYLNEGFIRICKVDLLWIYKALVQVPHYLRRYINDILYVILEMFKFFFLVYKQGQTRLAQYYDNTPAEDRVVLGRDS